MEAKIGANKESSDKEVDVGDDNNNGKEEALFEQMETNTLNICRVEAKWTPPFSGGGPSLSLPFPVGAGMVSREKLQLVAQSTLDIAWNA